MPNTQKVFVGNLARDARERDIEKFFKGYGKLGDISLKNGYGFVDFEDYRDAEDAAKDLDGKDMMGERIRVELAHDRRQKEREREKRMRFGGGGGRRSPGRRFNGDRGRFAAGGRDRRGNPPGRKTDHRIIVQNLSSRTSWQDLKDYFRVAGEITYTSAHKIRPGEGLVEFADKKGLDYALDKLDGTDLDGRKVRVIEERRKDERSVSRSRSLSRSRSRSRSRSGSRH